MPIENTALCNRLIRVVGQDNVQTDPRAITSFARSTLAEFSTPSLIVQPGSTEEVCQILLIASEFGTAVHPVSCGRNWGYGDRCAGTDGQLILHLGRMNRIRHIDPTLGYATVEPGVTQGQMAATLRDQELPFITDVTGAGPDASIVGNTVERGFGHSLYGDRYAHATSFEVVLADGRVLNTGMAHFPHSRIHGTYKWGIGPVLDGIFTQSNFGVVTAMTYWLIPVCESFLAYFFTLKHDLDIETLVDAMRPLRMSGTVRTPVHIFNAQRLISATQSAPPRTGQGAALTEDQVRTLCQKHGLGAWAGSGSFRGPREEVRGQAKALRRTLRSVSCVDQLFFFDETRLRLARRIMGFLGAMGLARRSTRLFAKLELGFDLLRGVPTPATLQGAFWRASAASPDDAKAGIDPLDRKAGFYWLAPIIPMSGTEVARFTRCVRPLFEQWQFDYQVTLSMVTGRALCAVTTISFDRSDEAETARAKCCYAAVFAASMEAGYIPYRANAFTAGSLHTMCDTDDTFWTVASAIKKALDPQGIISPGHYIPESSRHPNDGILPMTEPPE